MTHLSVEEILNYINVKKADEEALAFIANVNEHVLACSSCRERLEAFEAMDMAMCEAAFNNNIIASDEAQHGIEAENIL